MLGASRREIRVPALKLGVAVKRGAPRPITVEAGPCSLPIVTLALTQAEARALRGLLDDALRALRVAAA